MFDSGSNEHVCKEAFGGRGEEQVSKVKLNAVSGDAPSILGERKVIITLAGRKGPVDLEVIFQVSRNAQKNILSSGKLFRAGFKTIMNPEGQSYLEHYSMEDQIPLYMRGNSFYLRIMETRTVPMVTHTVRHASVAPMVEGEDAETRETVGLEDDVEEEIPMREVEDRFISRMSLTPSSRIVDMRARLKELGYTVGGSKEEVWKRLRKAEKEEYRRREKEKAKEAEIALRNQDVIQSEITSRSYTRGKSQTQPHDLPTATWCEHCMKGKGRETPHARTDGERATVQIDYSYQVRWKL